MEELEKRVENSKKRVKIWGKAVVLRNFSKKITVPDQYMYYSTRKSHIFLYLGWLVAKAEVEAIGTENRPIGLT